MRTGVRMATCRFSRGTCARSPNTKRRRGSAFSMCSTFIFTRRPMGSMARAGEPIPRPPPFQAFRAFRNFDGKGGRFLDLSIPTQGPAGVSLFASRDTGGSHIVAVALNLDPTYQVHAELDLSSCGGAGARRVYTYTPGMT